MTDIIDKIARAICQEQCAYRGEPACWKVSNGDPAELVWPNPNCDEPGCTALAKAVVEAFIYRPERRLDWALSDEAKRHIAEIEGNRRNAMINADRLVAGGTMPAEREVSSDRPDPEQG